MEYAEIAKQPLTILKIAQTFVALICFWITAAYKECGHLTIQCKTDADTNASSTTASPQFSEATYDICVEFPFDLAKQTIQKYCIDDNLYDYPFHISFKVQAIFFLWIGIMSFLFGLLTVGFLFKFWDKYHHNTFWAFPDLLASFFVCAYWLAGTSAFIGALINLKDYTSAAQMEEAYTAFESCKDNTCTVDPGTWGSYGGLNFACFLGVVNIALWAGSSFLIYRKILEIKISENSRFDASAYIDPPVQGVFGAGPGSNYRSTNQPQPGTYQTPNYASGNRVIS